MKIYILIKLLLVLTIATWAQEYHQDETFDLEETVNGAHIYEAKENITLGKGFTFSPKSSETFTAQINDKMLTSEVATTYRNNDGDLSTDPTDGYAVGYIPGQFELLASGAAIYTIPLEVPSGVNGMQPDLALTYNSQSYDGVAGDFWNISTQPEITRYYDNEAFNAMTTGDVYLLNGQLLVKDEDESTNDFTVYYTTAVNEFKVTAYEISDKGPEVFEVRDGAGILYTYTPLCETTYSVNKYAIHTESGNYQDETDDYVKYDRWLLTKRRDRFNNYISYEYEHSLEEQTYSWTQNISGISMNKTTTVSSYYPKNVRIASISYGSLFLGLEGNKVTELYNIDFNYVGRDSKLTTYNGCFEVIQEQKLASIVISDSEDDIKRYDVEYEEDRLQYVTMTYDEIHSIKSSDFVWSKTEVTKNDLNVFCPYDFSLFNHIVIPDPTDLPPAMVVVTSKSVGGTSIYDDSGTYITHKYPKSYYYIININNVTSFRDVSYTQLTVDNYVDNGEESVSDGVTIPVAIDSESTEQKCDVVVVDEFYVANTDKTIKIDYQDARYYDNQNGFLGFKKIIRTTVEDNIIETREFLLEDVFGFLYPYKTTCNKDGECISVVQLLTLIDDLDGRYKKSIETMTSENYIENTTTITNSIYDAYNNITYSGKQTSSTSSEDTLLLEKHYVYQDVVSWYPNSIDSLTSVSTNENGQYTRLSIRTYDDDGNLSVVKDNIGTPEETVASYTSYDAYGNLLIAKNESKGEEQLSTFTYTSDHRFLETSTNTLGQTNSYHYSNALGQLLSTTNYLGHTIYYLYDELNNQHKTIFADGTESMTSQHWDDGTTGLYYTHTQTTNMPDSWQWYNANNRLLKEQYIARNNQKVEVDYDYYADGKLKSISDPHYEGALSSINLFYEYDDYNRVENLIQMGDEIAYKYDGLCKMVTTDRDEVISLSNSVGQIKEKTINNKAVNFTYWPSGQLKTATPVGGIALEYEYNSNGQLTYANDPALGEIHYTYKGFGKLGTIRCSKPRYLAYISEYMYDTYGRLEQLIEDKATTDYTYNSSTGFVDNITKSDAIGQSFAYDGMGKIKSTTHEVSGTYFTSESTYADDGLLNTYTYPSGYTITYQYDDNSYLETITDDNNKTLWQAGEINAKGQWENTYKGGIKTDYTYHDDGTIESINAGVILSQIYTYGDDGNLDTKQDNYTGRTMSYDYDDYHQLEGWSYPEDGYTRAYTKGYDEHGNATELYSSATVLQYDAPANHQLTSVSGIVPEQLSVERQITYTSFNKVKEITQGDKMLSFEYGVDKQRIMSTYTEAGEQIIHYYVGNYEEVHYADGNIEQIHYISGLDGLAAIFKEDSVGSELMYTHTDYQGSIIALSDENGSLLERLEYDPWGRRIDATTGDYYTDASTIDHYISRGYTMHEHLDNFELINMNGRMYDPILGQFLSPDPMMQAPGFWLNHNRYTYCFNNPMVFTDPSGYVIDEYPHESMYNASSYHSAEDVNNGFYRAMQFLLLGESSAVEQFITGGGGGGGSNHTSNDSKGIFTGATFDDEKREMTITLSDGTQMVVSTKDDEVESTTDASSSGGETWYYGVEIDSDSDYGHAFAYNPNTNIAYEINHPNNGQTHGSESVRNGGPKSIGYKFDLNTASGSNAFWSFYNGRASAWLSPVNISNPQAAINFFEAQVGQSFDYNLLNNNCKHYAIQGLRIGGADISNWNNVPRYFSGEYTKTWHNPF